MTKLEGRHYYLTCSTMFLVPNIDQMYKEMKKIVEVRNKRGNGDEFPDFADLFFFGIKNARAGRKSRPTDPNFEGHAIGNTPYFFLAFPKLRKVTFYLIKSLCP
jgi:hypothetical protein